MLIASQTTGMFLVYSTVVCAHKVFSTVDMLLSEALMPAALGLLSDQLFMTCNYHIVSG